MRKTLLAAVLTALTVISGCAPQQLNTSADIRTKREIKPLDLHRTELDWLPEYDQYSMAPLQVDLRGYDLTRLDLHDRYSDLINADFDTATKWPYWLPNGYNPKKILNDAKNPGLGIDSLHKEGLMGNGVGVAIIDDVLLPNHEEYQGALRLYEEISCEGRSASVSGCRQASILVGKSTGIAPGADLYYIAEYCDTKQQTGVSEELPTDSRIDPISVYEPLVSAIKRVLVINDGLKNEKKIRVLCIGQAISKEFAGYRMVEQAIEKAESEGIFVVSSLLYDTSDYTMDFNGLGRDPLADPDNLDSYRPGHSWEYDLYTFGRYVRTTEGLLVPMDSRTTAAPTSNDRYAYYSDNDITFCIPFIGGMYALASQANPALTPGQFWDAALKTGDTLKIEINNISFKYKKVVNPARLIEAIKEKPE